MQLGQLSSRLRWAVAAGFILAAAGSAMAQPQQAPSVPSPPDAPSGQTGQVGFEQRPKLSPQDELAQGEQVVLRIDAASATVRRQLDGARTARDVVKSLCLSDKLSQVDVAGRSARDRLTALQSAAQRSDTELANHEFTILVVLRQRAEQLVGEANQCIGEEVAFVGTTQVTTEIDPNLVSEETTTIPPLASPFTTQPPCASCIR
jgi:uncharacterized membrane protein YdfJ with MMPL/SSD domain